MGINVMIEAAKNSGEAAVSFFEWLGYHISRNIRGIYVASNTDMLIVSSNITEAVS